MHTKQSQVEEQPENLFQLFPKNLLVPLKRESVGILCCKFQKVNKEQVL